MDNGLPKKWREMLAQEEALWSIFFWLAALAGQTSELASLWPEGSDEDRMEIQIDVDFLLYAPSNVYQLPELQALVAQNWFVRDPRQERAVGKIRKNPDFFRAFPTLKFETLDPAGLTPEDFAAQLGRITQKNLAVTHYLNWQALNPIPYSPAWKEILAAGRFVGGNARVSDLWVFRRRFREGLPKGPDFQQIWQVLAEVGTPLTLRPGPGFRQVGRVDLGRFSDPESDLDVGEQIAERLNA